MRHPFLTWTGWLTLSLAGCIHGLDGRKTATQSVSDQDSSASVVVGPFRKTPQQFAPAESKLAVRGTQSAKPNSSKRVPLPRLEDVNNATAKPAATKTASTKPASDLTTSSKVSTARRDSQVLPAQFQPQKPVQPLKPLVREPVFFPDDEPVPPAVTATQPQAVTAPQQLPVTKKSQPATTSSPSEPAPFAEFERAVPLSTKSTASKVTPVSSNEPVLAPPADEGVDIEQSSPVTEDAESNSYDAQAESLPMIFPSQSTSKPATPRELPPQATGLSKEQTSVADTSKSTARPRDVALLVEQVFEDLRQRRLDAARERTEWLKRLVAKGADPILAPADSAEASAATKFDGATPLVSREPKRLDVDEGKALSKDDDSPGNTSQQPAQSAADVPLSK